MQEYDGGWRGQTAVRERSFVRFVPRFDSLASLTNLNRTALLPYEKDKASVMADSIRHGYLLRGVNVKNSDAELMVGYETLESETSDLCNIIFLVPLKLCFL